MRQKAIIIILTLFAIPGLVNAATTGKVPKITGIAVHQGQTQQYFAATNKGLYTSTDGLSWTIAGYQELPATLVSETTAGTLYAFVVGKGLLRLEKGKSQWELVNNQFGAQYLLELSADPGNPEKLIALNQYGKLIVSNNSGKDWNKIKGPYKTSSEAEARGLALFRDNCQSCHGIDGVGETYNMQALTDKDYLRAPALNDSEHAWHHTDEGLTGTILNGSPREPRMIAWKDNGLTEENTQDVISYMKSLWTQRERDCQGPKHQDCPE